MATVVQELHLIEVLLYALGRQRAFGIDVKPEAVMVFDGIHTSRAG